MADLLDIVPTTAVDVVKINGQRLTVHSLSANAIGSLAARFPEIIQVLLGGLNAANGGAKLLDQAGAAVGPIIAAGCGQLGNEKAEHHASAFLLEDQLKMVMVIIGITFPNGLGFFEDLMKRFEEMAKRFSGTAGEEARKSYKIRWKTSPSPSPPLSEEASRPNLQ